VSPATVAENASSPMRRQRERRSDIIMIAVGDGWAFGGSAWFGEVRLDDTVLYGTN